MDLPLYVGQYDIILFMVNVTDVALLTHVSFLQLATSSGPWLCGSRSLGRTMSTCPFDPYQFCFILPGLHGDQHQTTWFFANTHMVPCNNQCDTHHTQHVCVSWLFTLVVIPQTPPGRQSTTIEEALGRINDSHRPRIFISATHSNPSFFNVSKW